MLKVITGSHVSAVVDVVGGWLLASVGVLVGVVDAAVVSPVVRVHRRGAGVAKDTQVRSLTQF